MMGTVGLNNLRLGMMNRDFDESGIDSLYSAYILCAATCPLPCQAVAHIWQILGTYAQSFALQSSTFIEAPASHTDDQISSYVHQYLGVA